MEKDHYVVEYEISGFKCYRVPFANLNDAFDYARDLERDSLVIRVEKECGSHWIEILIAEVSAHD